ncbi:MAG: DMT family transporter [Hyphomicrobiaceae bacterium]
MSAIGPAVALGMAAIAGACLATQAGINAQLGRYLGHPLWATFVSFAIGTLFIVPLLMLWRAPAPGLTAALDGPWWIWTGGVIGVFFVTAALVLAPQTGIAAFLGAMIAGQLLASLIIDHYGLIGLPMRPLTPSRVLGTVLIVAGVLVTQFPRTP